MQKVTVTKNGGFTEIRAERPYQAKPVIKREYHKGTGANRTRYYETVCGRSFVADTYDRIFVPAHAPKVKGRYFKGENPNGQLLENF